jgi:predicted dehydrogenase
MQIKVLNEKYLGRVNSMYKSLIIGAGSIGAWKDDKFDSPLNPDRVLTHAHAFYKHPEIELYGIIDKDIVRACQAGAKWSATYASNAANITEVLNAFGPFDIISVCTDTSTHFEIVEKISVSDNRPKVLIVEKPCGQNSRECKSIIEMCEETGIKLIVPYIRRFIPELRAIKSIIDCAEVVYAANIYYNRGLLRDGCHAIDFASYLFGRVEFMDVLHAQPIADYSADDLTRGIVLVMDRCKQVVMHPVDGRVGSIFEMDIITNAGRYRLIDNYAMIEHYRIVNEEVYGDYSRFFPTTENTVSTQLHRGLDFMAQNAVDVINGGHPLCSGQDALNVHKIIENINLR